MVASTQFDASIWAHPANSSKCLPVRTNKQDELQKLKEEVLNKEGEITILRTQLKQSKEHAELNYSKKLNESVDKIQLIQSEKERISTELDFKNMEIVNLKKKLENITKNLFDNSTLSKTSRIIDNSIIPLEVTKSSSSETLTLEEKIEPFSGTSKFLLFFSIYLHILSLFLLILHRFSIKICDTFKNIWECWRWQVSENSVLESNDRWEISAQFDVSQLSWPTGKRFIYLYSVWWAVENKTFFWYN